MLRRVLLALCALALASVQAHAQMLPGRSPGFRPGFQFIGGAGGFPASGAVVDYDFKGDRYSGPALSVSRASSAYIDDSAGNWTLVPANTLRRSDKGALIEGAQTNSIRNNSMQGAAVGSPGTVPTNWGISQPVDSGVTVSISGIGTALGIDYIDLRFSGTTVGASWSPSSAPISLEGATSIPALTGQLWSFSSFMQVVSGALPSSFVIALDPSERTSAGGLVRSNSAVVTVGSTLTRQSVSATLSGGAATAVVQPQIRMGFNAPVAGTAVNFTLRIGWPQLEQWSTSVTTVGGASSPIRTTGTAATRATDVVTAALPNSVSAGTLVAIANPSTIRPAGSAVITLSDGTSSNIYTIRSSTASPADAAFTGSTGGVGNVNPTGFTNKSGDGLRHAYAGAFATADIAFSVDGAPPNTSASGSPSAVFNQVRIGGAPALNSFHGYIERAVIWPYRAANSNVQTYSTLQNWGG